MISYVISLMNACLPVRAFAWKEVSTETLPDSCPGPLLFLLFSRRFPALSLLLGLLRPHKIEQLLFRVDLKLGIENAAHASTRTARAACLTTITQALPSALPLAPACAQATWSTNTWAKPENVASDANLSFNPSPFKRKDQPTGWSFLFLANTWVLSV